MLWTIRQLLREAEKSAASDRHEVEGEMLTRMEQEGAAKTPLGSDMFVTQQSKTDYAYTRDGVERLREFLVDGGLVSEEEWNRVVSWTPRVDRRAVNKWLKLGDAVKALVDQATMGATGKPRLDGPDLKELQNKRPDVVAEAAGKL